MYNQLIFVILLALVFEFLNGMRDSSNIVATMIFSRAFQPWTALGITAVAEFLGPFLFGVSVATTIASDIVDSNVLTLDTIVACLLGAITWNLITWYFGFPSSSSHAMVGGMIGAVFVSVGMEAIKLEGFYRVLVALFVSPIIGFIVGFILLRIINFLSRDATPRINEFFGKGQFFTAVGLAFSHGTNDAQKTMGLIVLSLIIGGVMSDVTIPSWVIFLSASVMALGTLFGGRRLIRTLGGKFYKIRPLHGFATQLTSTIVISTATIAGLPVSTTQVVSSAIVGVGASERFGKVRWGVAGDILTTWIVTIPASALFSAGYYWLIYIVR
jgi:inorganic phosphate transporter, PiT family